MQCSSRVSGLVTRVSNMSAKQETGQDDPENEVNIQSLFSRRPPLILLPWPGHWAQQNKTVRDNICLNFVHSSSVVSCDIGYLLCLSCWSVIALALEYLPLNSGQIYRVELMVTV